jgi:hypothetical protein
MYTLEVYMFFSPKKVGYSREYRGITVAPPLNLLVSFSGIKDVLKALSPYLLPHGS